MALPNRNGLEMVHLTAHSLDVTTSGADRCFAAIVSPVRGRLVRVKAVSYGTMSGTGSNATTVKINTTTISGATLTFTSGTIAGTTQVATTANSPIVQQGDVVSFTSDGAGSNLTTAMTYQCSIRRI